MPKVKPPELSTCVFSDDPKQRYRYSLENRWDDDTPIYARKTVVWVMLNPSTANQDRLDPTLRRCKGFSQSLGAGGMIIVNLFAFRATLPKVMLAFSSSIGPLNDEAILKAVEREGVIHIIAGWGKDGNHLGRAARVMDMLKGRLSALKVNGDGTPGHPLYLPSSSQPQPYGL